MNLVPWPLEPGDTVRWWDGSRHRTGRYQGTVNKIVARKIQPHARVEEPVVTEEGTVWKVRVVHPEALRPSNDQRSIRSRGHAIYLKEDGWTTTIPARS